jgi:hypothetical protein
MPEEQEQIRAEAIAAWLGTEGYRLEYQTLKAVRDAGMEAVLGSYVCSEEGSMREIDVNAALVKERGDNYYEMRWVCECKYTSRKPWVLLDQDASMKLEEIWDATPKSSKLAGNGALRHHARLAEAWHFDVADQIAHTVIQAKVKFDKTNKAEEPSNQKKNNQDFAFESLQKITHAGWDIAELNEKKYRSFVMGMTIPCIVIDGPLFLAKFDYDMNEFVASQVASGRVCWSGCRSGTIVDVVNVAEVNSYAKKVKTTFDLVMQIMMENS